MLRSLHCRLARAFRLSPLPLFLPLLSESHQPLSSRPFLSHNPHRLFAEPAFSGLHKPVSGARRLGDQK